MIKYLKRGFVSLLCVCFAILSLCACNTDTTTQPEQGDLENNLENDIEVTPGVYDENNPEITPGANEDIDTQLNQTNPLTPMEPNMEKAENIEIELNKMNEIETANVIILGNTALIAYNPTDNAADVNANMDMIVNKTREIDSSIVDVRVSKETEIMDRLNELEDNIDNNIPINDINNEFNDIIRVINPLA